MRILLDTHVFLWYITADPKLPHAFRESIQNPDNEIYLSAASIWEAVIKHMLGKLSLPESPAILFPREREAHRILPLPINETAFAHLAKLPSLHGDPFDWILIAQAVDRNLALMTVDQTLRMYGVPVLNAG